MQSSSRPGRFSQFPTKPFVQDSQQAASRAGNPEQLSTRRHPSMTAHLKPQGSASRPPGSSMFAAAPLPIVYFQPAQSIEYAKSRGTPSKSASHYTKIPPPFQQDVPPADDPANFFNVRFMDNKNSGSGSARTATHLSAPADQTFVEINTKNDIRFLNITTPTILSKKRSLDSDGESSEEATKRYRNGSNKRAHIESHEEAHTSTVAPVKTTKIELRTNKPLRNAEDVHMDVWRLILKYTPLRFLLTAKDIDRRFYQMLKSESSVWLESRINQYSESMPGPPDGMTEQQYAQLLEGKGCQNISCPKKSTGKIYWAFCLRLCEACFASRTMKEEVVKRYHLIDPTLFSLLSLLPAAVVDGGKYSRCRLINPQTDDWETTTAGPVYSSDQVHAIEAEYQQLVNDGKTADEIAAWKSQKKEQVVALTSHLAEIENWEKDRAEAAPRHRLERRKFFQEQAAQLKPPMPVEVLEKMLAFKMSLDANTVPTENSWKVLKRKILPYRAEAEKLVSYDKQMHNYGRGDDAPDIDDFIALRNKRSLDRLDGREHPTKEQELVLSLAGAQLEDWKHLGVSDADLALRVLRGVFETYGRMLGETNGNGSRIDLHHLTLDDARLVVNEVLEPWVRSWDDPRRTTIALGSFKCAGCPRKDCKTKYTFAKGFEHIYATHAKYVGEDTEFAMFAKPYPRHVCHELFPWYTVRWPRNLPLVAAHHVVSRQDKWLPDADIPYVSAKEPSTISAFASRNAYDNPSIDQSDFEGNLVFAAQELQPTTLGSRGQTRVALQYALDRYSVFHEKRKPSLVDFTTCLKKIKEANRKFDFKYRCAVCCRQTNVPRTTKFIKSPVHFHELEEHFEKKHANCDWTTDMMDLPSGEQLRDLILEGDAALKEQQEAVRAREEAAKNSLRKKPSPKAQVTLTTPTSMEVFDKLYVRI